MPYNTKAGMTHYPFQTPPIIDGLSGLLQAAREYARRQADKAKANPLTWPLRGNLELLGALQSTAEGMPPEYKVVAPVQGIPGWGDAAGASADLAYMYRNPEERTLGNAGLTLAGLAPGIPPMLATKNVGKSVVEGLLGTPKTELTAKGLLANDQVGDLATIRTQHDLFGTNFSQEGKKYVNWVKRNQNKSAVHSNAKTGFSIDFSTNCPKRSCASGACAYCYVEQPRTQKDLGIKQPMSPKKVDAENPYRGELQAMPSEVVNELNRDGGMRMFSFGDYRPDKDFDSVAGVLRDAHDKGLYIKAITKEKSLIDAFGDHPNFRANISIDAMPKKLSNAPTLNEALEWKAGRKNIKIRAVALNEEQARMYAADPRVDIVTLYHGPTGEKLEKIVRHQNPDLIKRGESELIDNINTWENMPPHSKKAKALQKEFPGKFCCLGGKCAKDNNKCGFGLGAVLTGVMVKEWMPDMEQEGETPEL